MRSVRTARGLHGRQELDQTAWTIRRPPRPAVLSGLLTHACEFIFFIRSERDGRGAFASSRQSFKRLPESVLGFKVQGSVESKG